MNNTGDNNGTVDPASSAFRRVHIPVNDLYPVVLTLVAGASVLIFVYPP